MDIAEFAATAAVQLGHVVTAARRTAEEVICGEYPASPASLVEHLPVLHHLIDLRSNTPLGDPAPDRVTYARAMRARVR